MMIQQHTQFTLLKRAHLIALTLLSASLLSLSSASTAHAIPFLKQGVVIGYGFGLPEEVEGLEQEISNFAIGGSVMLDIPVVKLELNVLYLGQTITNRVESELANTDASEVIGDSDPVESSFLSIPVIARFNLSPIPLLDFGIGAGYERRFYLGDGEADELNYVPLSARADFKVPFVASLGIEARFSYHLADNPVHDFMAFGHVSF